MKGIWLLRNGWIAVVNQELTFKNSAVSLMSKLDIEHVKYVGDVYILPLINGNECITIKSCWNSSGCHYLNDKKLDLCNRKLDHQQWPLLMQLGIKTTVPLG